MFVSVFMMHKPSSFLVSLLYLFWLRVLHCRPCVAFSSPFLRELEMELMYRKKKKHCTFDSNWHLFCHQIIHYFGKLNDQSLQQTKHRTLEKKPNLCLKEAEKRKSHEPQCWSVRHVRQLPSLPVMWLSSHLSYSPFPVSGKVDRDHPKADLLLWK